MDVDQVGAGVEVILPDLLEDHPPGEHLAGVAHHELQQLELHRQQLDAPLAAERLVLDQVELQVGDPQTHLGAGACGGGAAAPPGAPPAPSARTA